MKILIAEDEAALSTQLVAALTEAGYAVDCAATASAPTSSARPSATTPRSSTSACRRWTA